MSAVCPSAAGTRRVLTQVPLVSTTSKQTHTTAGLLTKTSVPVSVEALVALAEIGANDVSTASIVVTPVAT